MTIISATPASPGIVIGRAYHVQRTKTNVVYQEVIGPGQVVGQLHVLDQALAKAEEELKRIWERVEKELPAQAVLIEAHLMILRDPMFLSEVRKMIENSQVTAAWAVISVAKMIAEKFSGLDDPYLRSRVEDLETVAERIVRFIQGGDKLPVEAIQERAILIAHHLSPADTTQLNVDRVMGFVTEMGGRTSHTAIVAQALGLPAVVGLEQALEKIPSGSVIILDGTKGQVIVDPDDEYLIRYEDLRERYSVFTAEMKSCSAKPARTSDGRQLTVLANIEQPQEGLSALEQGAEGIGLFRTEFLYLSQPQLPKEEQLFQNYGEVVRAMEGRPVTIRTLDIGGDKFAHHFDLVPEMNPAMGLRAVRFCLRRVDIFKTQLRAILRASALGPVRVMFPMISGVQELRQCAGILDQCREELKEKGVPHDENLKVGCMLEVPSAVFVADLLAREVDFVSIGTNDLIQYSLAIDRVNEYVSHMYKPFHPAILRMVATVIKAGEEAGIPVSMCGEMAADPCAVPLLLGMGLTEVSVNPQAVPRVKHIIRMSSWTESIRLAQKALQFETEELISRFLTQDLNRLMPETFGPDGLMLY